MCLFSGLARDHRQIGGLADRVTPCELWTVPTAVLNSYQLTTVAHLMIDYSSSAES